MASSQAELSHSDEFVQVPMFLEANTGGGRMDSPVYVGLAVDVVESGRPTFVI